MAKYFYLPRSDDELLGMIREWNEMRDDGEKYLVLEHSALGHPLKHIKPGDRLYIFGHGNMGQGIGPSGHGIEEKELAARIKADGLPLSHPEIRLFACNTAVKMQGQIAPFAQRLAEAMVKCGYRGIRVVGYIGFMSLPKAIIKNKMSALETSLTHDVKDIERAKGRKMSFNATEHGVIADSPTTWVGTQSQGPDRQGVQTTLYKVCRVP